jgi:amicyanin
MGGSGQGGMIGSGGMMGSGGHGMMGGSGQGGQGQTPAGTPTTGVTQVAIQNFAYQPSNIQVKAGTTVTWTNQDSAPHTVTFRNGMKDSGMLRQGQSFRYTFTQPGAYEYYCAYHPNMVATVAVIA